MDVRKIKVLQVLQEGKTITEVCEEVGINRSTYYLWLNNDTEFQTVKKDMEQKLLDELYAISLSEVKEELLKDNCNSFYKLQVLQSLLKIKNSEKLEVLNKTLTLDELLKEMDAEY